MKNEAEVIQDAAGYTGHMNDAGRNRFNSRSQMAGVVANFAQIAVKAGADADITAPAQRLTAPLEAGNAPTAKSVQNGPAQVASLRPGAASKRHWAGVIEGPKPY